MKIRTMFISSAVVAAFAAMPGWANPNSYIPSGEQAQQPPIQTQAATGKVTSVAPKSMTIEVKNGEDPTAMDFAIDTNTKIEGKLEVGVSATVEYRVDKDKGNIAMRVVVIVAH